MKTLKTHLETISRDNDVQISWVPNWKDAHAFVLDREVALPRLYTTDPDADYLMGLHELGHVLFPEAVAYEDPGLFNHLARESMAWSWAAANALDCDPTSWTRVLTASLVGHFRYVVGTP